MRKLNHTTAKTNPTTFDAKKAVLAHERVTVSSPTFSGIRFYG